MSDNELYQKLMEISHQMVVLEQISGLLGWDAETMMPKKAVEQRGGMMAFLSKLEHEMTTDPELGKLISELEKIDSFNEIEKRNIYLMRRNYDQKTKIPVELVVERAKLSMTAVDVWKKARAENDWNIFAPYLEKQIEINKKIANYLDPDKDPYDVLLDLFEPGMTIEKYNKLFDELKAGTIELINKIKNAEIKGNRDLITRKVDIPTQEKIMHKLMKIIGYDTEGGRLDITTHPFTGGPGYDDVRITTRYIEDDFASSFFSVAHEGGHGIYEQNVCPDHRYEPIGHSCSMGIHESQSRFFENILCRSEKFWEYFFPELIEMTGETFKDVKFNDFMRAINIVQPSLIRIEADEVTYNLHIIIRYEIERDIMHNKLDVKDIPAEWDRKYKEYLGVDVDSVANGALQDIHWSGGAIGYFPTYSLGNIYGAQFLNTLKQDIPEWEDLLSKGNFIPIKEWLNKKIHHMGNKLDPIDLVTHVTGEAPNPKYLLNYLNDKYSKLYNL